MVKRIAGIIFILFCSSVAWGILGATILARTYDTDIKHMTEIFQAAGEHRGTAFVEIYQNCVIFNDNAFAYMTDKENRDDAIVHLEHGKPLVFGKGRDKGIRLNGTDLEVIALGGEHTEADCLVWDESTPGPVLPFLAAHLLPPEFPTPIGVLRAIEKPAYEQGVAEQIRDERERKGAGTLEELIWSGDLWKVGDDGAVSRWGA